MLSVLLLSVLFSDGVVRVTEPLFPKLSSQTATVAPDGTLYVLDTIGCQIYPISLNGKVGRPFARKGQGPGELEFGYGLHWSKGLLAVSENKGLSLFKPDGSFVRLGGGDSGPFFRLTQAGAIAGAQLVGLEMAPEKTSVWALNSQLDVSQRKALLSYPRPPRNNTTTAIQKDGNMTWYLCPVSDNFLLTGTPDGKWVQLYFPQAKSVRIFDGLKHQQVAEIPLAEGPVPNQAFVDQYVERWRKNWPSKPGYKVKILPQVPEHCPRLRMMNVIGDQLYLVFWSNSPDREQPVQAYTPDGKPSKPRFSGKAVQRIIGLAGERAWVLLEDEDEEALIPMLVPLAELEKRVVAKPYLNP